MAIRRRDQLKRFFKRGAYPTESQFGDLIESMRHKLEGIPMADVEGLTAAINGMVDQSTIDAVKEAQEAITEELEALTMKQTQMLESLRECRRVADDFAVDFGSGNDPAQFNDDNYQADAIAGNCSEGDIVYARLNGEEHRTRVLQIEDYAVLLIEVSRGGGVWIWELNYEHGLCYVKRL